MLPWRRGREKLSSQRQPRETAAVALLGIEWDVRWPCDACHVWITWMPATRSTIDNGGGVAGGLMAEGEPEVANWFELVLVTINQDRLPRSWRGRPPKPTVTGLGGRVVGVCAGGVRNWVPIDCSSGDSLGGRGGVARVSPVRGTISGCRLGSPGCRSRLYRASTGSSPETRQCVVAAALLVHHIAGSPWVSVRSKTRPA